MPTTDIDDLRRHIGREVNHQGTHCRIIEVLEDGPTLVLQDTGSDRVVQDNRFGEAHRRVPPTFVVPVTYRHPDGSRALHPDFLALELDQP
jgi:hypothetical protein